MATTIGADDRPNPALTPAEALNLAARRLQAGNAAGALAICDQLLSLTPRQVEPWQLSGLALFALERFEDAARRFEQAVAIDPADSAHRINLANALIKLGRDRDAGQAFAKALALAPDSPEIQIGLGTLARRAGRLEDAVAHADRALAGAPDSYQALVNRGRALHELGRFADAAASYDRAIALAPMAAPAHAAKSLTLLLAGDFDAGWREYEWRGEAADLAARARFPEPEWAGEPLPGGTLLVHAEQGFGDTIQFARFVSPAASRVGHIVFEVQPALKTLIATLAPRVKVLARGETLPPFDRQIRLMSLPRVLGIGLPGISASVPYLKSMETAPSGLLPADPRLTVGLSWAGNPAHENDSNRSISAERFDRLGAMEGIRFVSVQKDGGGFAVRRPGFPLLDLGQRLQDFADLAAILARLDLLIAVDSAPAHLMGALGRPVWILLPEPPDWRWMLNREDSGWYPTARLFRQPRRGDWSGVIDRVGAELGQFRDGWSRR